MATGTGFERHLTMRRPLVSLTAASRGAGVGAGHHMFKEA